MAAFDFFIAHDAFDVLSRSNLYKSSKLACDDAGVPFFSPYTLRHSYATVLRAEGMDLADVQQVLGHKSAKATERYAAVSANMLTHAGELLQKAWGRGTAASTKKIGWPPLVDLIMSTSDPIP